MVPLAGRVFLHADGCGCPCVHHGVFISSPLFVTVTPTSFTGYFVCSCCRITHQGVRPMASPGPDTLIRATSKRQMGRAPSAGAQDGST